jgi:hypothetical protein
VEDGGRRHEVVGSEGGATMAQYVLLYGGGKMPETDEEQKAIMQAWTDWFTELGPVIVDPGNPFTGQAKTVGSDGSISDGADPASASGYSIIEAESLDRAAEITKGCPVIAGGASIAVFETFEVM